MAADQYWHSAHLSFFYGAILAPQNKGIGRIVRMRGRRAPAVDSRELWRPQLGSMADVAMEGEGKAGGRMALDHFSCVL